MRSQSAHGTLTGLDAAGNGGIDFFRILPRFGCPKRLLEQENCCNSN
jgi:hypothetical protein